MKEKILFPHTFFIISRSLYLSLLFQKFVFFNNKGLVKNESLSLSLFLRVWTTKNKRKTVRIVTVGSGRLPSFTLKSDSLYRLVQSILFEQIQWWKWSPLTNKGTECIKHLAITLICVWMYRVAVLDWSVQVVSSTSAGGFWVKQWGVTTSVFVKPVILDLIHLCLETISVTSDQITISSQISGSQSVVRAPWLSSEPF